MKTILSMSIVSAFLVLISFSCKKTNSQDELNANLSQTETVLLKSYQDAKSNADLLATQVGPNGQYTNPGVMNEDKLYHMNDSLFSVHYLTYCKDMMDGDNMMGGNSMMGGGNAVHGSGMMGTHAYMGDTTKVNQCYRDLKMIRQAHTAHHPILHP